MFRKIGGGWSRITLFVQGVPEYANRIYGTPAGKFNPFTGICSCNRYTENKHRYEPLDIRLLCRHLQKFYAERLTPDADSLQYQIIKSGRNYTGGEFFTKDDIYLFYKPGSEWCEFFIRQPHWIRFSYSLTRYRWAYGKKPDISPVILPG